MKIKNKKNKQTQEEEKTYKYFHTLEKGQIAAIHSDHIYERRTSYGSSNGGNATDTSVGSCADEKIGLRVARS